MERLLLEDLLVWKDRPERQPVLLDGARQVGKTYLLQQLFGRRHFRRVHTLDLRKEPRLCKLFEDSLDPDRLLPKIELELGEKIDLRADLLLLDEIGECQRAVDSLKYFAEQRPDGFVVASGSNIGLLDSFPVGKVENLRLFPMTFEEFLMAAGNDRLLQQYREMSRDTFIHGLLWEQFLDYYFVGGMPAAVAAWFWHSDADMPERTQGDQNLRVNNPPMGLAGYARMSDRTQKVQDVHRNLIAGFERDFGKYCGKQSSLDLNRVFQNVPVQLDRSMDGSARRFRFKDVLPRKNRYAQLCGPIDWLESARLISRCYLLDCRPAVPLRSLVRENVFKLFLLDVGLAGHMLGLSYRWQIDQEFAYKGFIAENFVQNELLARGMPTSYAWDQGQAEVEFLYQTVSGSVIPVEVKSGSRTRARSLWAYREKYRPEQTLKLIGGPGGPDRQDMVWPLYYARFLAKL